MESYYINEIPERGTPVYHVSQGDAGRTIRCNLYDGASVKKLGGTESIRFRYRKPNGDVSSFSVTNTGLSFLDISIPASLTDVVGKVYCKLKIDNIGWKAFYIEVERRP